MIFQPTIPLSGIGGWQFLQRTQEAQKAVFDKSPEIARNVEYFKENISKADTVDKLLSDRRLLQVALGAFSLEEEIEKKAYIRKVLEEGTEDSAAFANRIADKRYRDFAKAFGYGNLAGTQVRLSDFAGKIAEAYKTRQFEVAVGQADNDMRMAMAFKREIASYGEMNSTNTAWYSLMGNKPLRTVIETALGLPKEFAALDIDRQLDDLKSKTRAKFGEESLKVFQDPEVVDRAIRDFLVRRQIAGGPSAFTPGSAALSLLQNSGFGATSAANLLLSQS